MGYHSRFIWIYLFSEKRALSQVIMNLFSSIESQFDKQLKMVRSDNETKFTCLKHNHSKCSKNIKGVFFWGDGYKKSVKMNLCKFRWMNFCVFLSGFRW